MDWQIILAIVASAVGIAGLCASVFFGILEGFKKLYDSMQDQIGEVVENKVSPMFSQVEDLKKKYEENTKEDKKYREELHRQVKENREDIKLLCKKDKELEKSIARHDRRFTKISTDMQRLYDAFLRALKELGLQNGK